MTIQPPTQIVDELARSYQYLRETLDRLTVAECEAPCLDGDWSPQALLAHVAYWDDYQTQRMTAAIRGESAQHGFTRPSSSNDARAALDAARAWADVVAEADAARQRLIDFAHDLDRPILDAVYPEGERTLSIAKRLAHMVQHTHEHARAVSAYSGSMQRWERAALRRFLEAQYENLMDSLGGLTEEVLLTVPVCGHWCSRDVFAHVLSWNEYGHMIVTQWPNPDQTEVQKWLANDLGETIDETNKRLLAERAHMSMIEIADGLVTLHRRMLRAFDNFSNDDLASSGDYGWGETGELSNWFYGLALHEAEHAADIWYYRTQTA